MQSNNVSILVVDDEQIIVNILTTFLTENGYDVTGLSDSRVALKYIKENAYDIVLTDLMMPDVSGMEVVKAVRETGRDTQSIIFTGFASIESAIEAIQYGVYDYIRKPLELKEINVVINRAVEKLHLSRENIALNKKIEKMLSEITMLYDISSILYQVQDHDMVIDMVLDTLTEGMRIKKAGLFLFDEQSGTFRIIKSSGLSGEFIKHFTFRIGDRINNVELSSTESVIIPHISGVIKVNDNKLDKINELNQCILIPIRYLEKLIGFIGIFHIEEEEFSLEDELKLLKILATQIAPIFQSVQIRTNQLEHKLKPHDKTLFSIIDEGIAAAKKIRSSVSFLLIRLLDCARSDNLPLFPDVSRNIEEILRNEFGSGIEIFWQNIDSLFIILHGGNPVNVELSCEHIRRAIEELHPEENGNSVLSMKYAVVTYPIDGGYVSEILNGLWVRLLSELREQVYF